MKFRYVEPHLWLNEGDFCICKGMNQLNSIIAFGKHNIYYIPDAVETAMELYSQQYRTEFHRVIQKMTHKELEELLERIEIDRGDLTRGYWSGWYTASGSIHLEILEGYIKPLRRLIAVG